MVGTATVRLDVGGKVYKVSRSLLEQHPGTMIAKLVSDAWHKEGNGDGREPLFIEGNGDRFQYILDYMRRGKVWLPANNAVSKNAIMEDLDYYGFENVSPHQIHSTYSPQHLLDLEYNQACVHMAFYCFYQYKQYGCLSISVNSWDRVRDDEESETLLAAKKVLYGRKEPFDECLYKFGLKHKSSKFDALGKWIEFELEKL